MSGTIRHTTAIRQGGRVSQTRLFPSSWRWLVTCSNVLRHAHPADSLLQLLVLQHQPSAIRPRLKEAGAATDSPTRVSTHGTAPLEHRRTQT